VISLFAFKAEAANQLEADLPQGWTVERFIDPDGDLSIIILPDDDDPVRPAFLLHDRNEIPHVATIVADDWQSDRPCASWAAAAATVIGLVGGTSRPRAALQAA
jgi:hypothetical protein